MRTATASATCPDHRRLDYVAALGVDGIWLSPFFVSPMKDFGYDVADYCDVDPLFGTLADFDALLARAHALGLKVIIDQVYSHSSDQHPWFEESRQSRDNPKADWYVWADPKPDGTPPNNWLAVFGGPPWTWEPRRRQYYLHNFLQEQPDLNLHNPAVQEAVLGAARFWLDRGVDGFRIDVANFFCHDPRPARQSAASASRRRTGRPYRCSGRCTTATGRRRWPSSPGCGRCSTAIPSAWRWPRSRRRRIRSRTMIAYTDGPDRYHTAYSFVLMSESFGAALHARRARRRCWRARPRLGRLGRSPTMMCVRVVAAGGGGADEADAGVRRSC